MCLMHYLVIIISNIFIYSIDFNQATAYHDMQVEVTLEAGAGALPEGCTKVKASADLMTTILQQLVELAFKYALQVMTTN